MNTSKLFNQIRSVIDKMNNIWPVQLNQKSPFLYEVSNISSLPQEEIIIYMQLQDELVKLIFATDQYPEAERKQLRESIASYNQKLDEENRRTNLSTAKKKQFSF